ncbi:MAG: transporter substrate-binding domain-containing protein, partial [Phyllobacterium sp.]
VTVRTYKSSPERDLDLKAGRIDAGFDSGVYATSMLAKPGNGDLQMSGPLVKGAMLATEVALGTRKGEAELKRKFDAAIKASARDGVIRTLSEKWSKLDLTPTFTDN